jgi:LmbE family N-acetylglucosaminyl deacetylase
MHLQALLLSAAVMGLPLLAQAPLPVKDAAELQKALDKLQVMGSVLYLAAHPDDENTAVLATLSRGRNLRTAYLSMTRGGGGQNLIGPELGDALAVLRTQELRAARRIDGAEQFFTGAVDFGFSKTAEETLRLWDHRAALADVVRTIRTFRPDVILSRFPPDARGGHGHHTASALLAIEAFTAAADPASFPEQIKAGLRPWKAQRLLWNHFRFSEEAPPVAANSLRLDVGAYDPILGKSYGELAAESRSQHRTQGFGVLAQRGAREESFELLAGTPAKQDLFEGVDLTWARIPGGSAVGARLREARAAYRSDRPGDLVPFLLRARSALETLPTESRAEPLVQAKTAELEEALRAAAGLWVEAITDRQAAAPGDRLTVAVAAVARGGVPLTLESLALETVTPGGVRCLEMRPVSQRLEDNLPRRESFSFTLPADAPLAQPPWLGGPGAAAWAGLAEAPAPYRLRAGFARAEGRFEVTVPVQFRFRDPVLGERYQPLAVVPAAQVNLTEGVQVFAGPAAKEVRMRVLAGAASIAGKVRLRMPLGWTVDPAELTFSLGKAGDEKELSFRLSPPEMTASGELRVDLDLGSGFVPARGLQRLEHPHIPLQTLLPEAKVRLERFELKHDGRRIGYVMGAGDEIPQALRRIGYEVELLSDEALAREDLRRFNAIVLGIRAFNTRPALRALKERLHTYVAEGGTEIVLYTVNIGFPGINAGMVTPDIGPFPFKVGRTRVTDETAPVRFLQSGHPVFHWPNEITPKDFEGWVQDRSLYHAEKWDPRYQPLLGIADAGEKEDGGALIVAEHGKGHYVYTGLAFFRQLPDGVPGATRLFANLLALGSHP